MAKVFYQLGCAGGKRHGFFLFLDRQLEADARKLLDKKLHRVFAFLDQDRLAKKSKKFAKMGVNKVTGQRSMTGVRSFEMTFISSISARTMTGRSRTLR